VEIFHIPFYRDKEKHTVGFPIAVMNEKGRKASLSPLYH
jgi:hypothetical protein